MKTKAALLAVPLAATMLLAGCDGAATPQTSPPSTAASAPTTSAPSTAGPTTDPDIPAPARAHTIGGAEAFVRYYFQQLNIAWTRPRAGILSPLCQASSKSCAANEESATRLTRQGHRYDGDPVTVKFVGVLDTTKKNNYEVLANVVQERRSEIDKAGRIYVTDKRKALHISVALLYTDHAWSVATIKVMK